MVIREVQDRDFVQLAEMRWTHAVEDDETTANTTPTV